MRYEIDDVRRQISLCLPFEVSCQRKGDSAAAVQGVGDVDDLQGLGVPQLLKILLYLVLNGRGQHLLDLPQLDEELGLVGQHLLCERQVFTSAVCSAVTAPRTVMTRTCNDTDDQNVSGCFIAALIEGEDLSEEEEEWSPSWL